jgi:hypothetical protein
MLLQVASILSLGVEEDLDRHEQTDLTLTLAEASAGRLTAQQGKYLRTEQEWIPMSDAERALKQARASPDGA